MNIIGKNEEIQSCNPNTNIDVSVIVPIYNGAKWIDRCFEAILAQTARKTLKLEVCVCDDSSTDDTNSLLKKWKSIFADNKIGFCCYENISGAPKGVGYAKNKAVAVSHGEFLCFQDVDDAMLPNRISSQYASVCDDTIVGCKFKREPENSTVRYTNWANNLSQRELEVQIYTSHGPTVIMPTWFFHKRVFNKVGGFVEDGAGVPEDLIFFYKHLDLNGKIRRVDEILLIYNYHPEATTFSIKQETIWDIRMERLQAKVLSKWSEFTVWNAGKQGRRFYRALSEENRSKVRAFCDVDVKKVGQFYQRFDAAKRTCDRKVDIVHFTVAEPPLVICVKMDLTGGDFEENLESLKLKEGRDYVYFS